LKPYRSIISGSTVLHFALQGTEQVLGWKANDLDIYCPLTTAASVIYYLVKEEHYVVVQTVAHRDRTFESLHEYDNGAVASVTTLLTPDGKKVDIIAATRNAPLLPITYFWTTLVTNYMTADSICLAYPRLTLQGIGLLNPIRIPAPRVLKCISKYQKRRFTFKDFAAAPSVHHTFHNPKPLLCPHTFRTFTDTGCLQVHFSPNRNRVQPLPLFPIYHPMWTYGGPLCAGGCKPASPRRSLHLTAAIV
ncbi:hypothetical protein BV25DRAFT_1816584, partial [Artomyces pyxidatus]